MDQGKRWAMVLAALAVACGGEPSRPYASGSLFLMNQTHDVVRLSEYRTEQLDCLEVARGPSAALAQLDFRFERCVTLGPAELTALDRGTFPEQPLQCDAVAIQGAGLEPHGIFWTDMEDRFETPSVDATLEILASGRELLLEPARQAAIGRLPPLPEHPCDWWR